MLKFQNSIKITIKFSAYFSLSPCHFEIKSADETDINVELLASAATALAKCDLPVPGG